jgi:glutamine cyclotransferase
MKKMKSNKIIILCLIVITLIIPTIYACSNNKNEIKSSRNNDKKSMDSTTKNSNENLEKQNKITKYKVEIVDTLPHLTSSYTQGLLIHQGKIYEGTGQFRESKLMKIKLENGEIEESIPLENTLFGEGVTIFDNKIYQLTWMNQICLVYDLKTLKKISEFSYSGEGWGLTSNDSLLFMSDGSSIIKVINPKNFTTISNLQIKKNNQPVRFLNELELVDSLLYANVYMQDLIIVANINTGEVVADIDISALRPLVAASKYAEVSNGIAFNPKTNLFYLTGKYWDKIFIVKFVEIE